MPQRTPVTGRARLLLEITVTDAKGKERKTLYHLRYLEPPAWANPAWRLTKGDGSHYNVHLGQFGPECDCPDFNWCRQNTAKGCKHVAALRAEGLLRKGDEW